MDLGGFLGDGNARVDEIARLFGGADRLVADERNGHDPVGALVEAGGFEVKDHERAVEPQPGGQGGNGIFSHGQRMAQRETEEKHKPAAGGTGSKKVADLSCGALAGSRNFRGIPSAYSWVADLRGAG